MTGLIFYLSVPFGILGIIFSVLQKKKVNFGLNTAGLVLSIIGLAFGGLVVFGAFMVGVISAIM